MQKRIFCTGLYVCFMAGYKPLITVYFLLSTSYFFYICCGIFCEGYNEIS